MSDLTQIGRLWPKRMEMRAAYDATDADGKTDAIFVHLDWIEGEILRCQAVTVKDLQCQAEVVDHQNLSRSEAGIYLAPQVFQLLQSIRGSPSIVGPPGVEQMCAEVISLQEAINDCHEFKVHNTNLCADDAMRPLAHFAVKLDRIATKRKDALIDLICTKLPTTLDEVQMMHLVLVEATEAVTSDASPADRQRAMCSDLTIAIRDGLERLTGKSAIDLGMSRDIDCDPLAPPRLPAERRRLTDAVRALYAWLSERRAAGTATVSSDPPPPYPQHLTH